MSKDEKQSNKKEMTKQEILDKLETLSDEELKTVVGGADSAKGTNNDKTKFEWECLGMC